MEDTILSEEHLEMVQRVSAEIAERAPLADKDGVFPQEDGIALRQSGFCRLSLSEEVGGFGLSLQQCVAAQLELAKASTSTALVAGMNMQVLGHESDCRLWPQEIFEAIGNAATSDGILINSVASEPKLGSPSRGGSFQTAAALSDDKSEWTINGHKNWITGGKNLTHMFIKLSLDAGNGTLLVEQDRPGLQWEETWGDSLSLRASDSHDLYLRDVVVPAANLAVEPGQKTFSNMWFPLVMGATYLGGAIGARDAIIKYALERVPTALGKPIATLPKIQRQIGEIDAMLQAAKAFMLETAALWPGGIQVDLSKKIMPRFAAAKMLATETATTVTEKTLQVAGGASISRDLPLERFFRDVRAGAMHPPSGDAGYEMIGRAALGLNGS
ncbi:MAG: acyl-CoA dehydrogenase family protein [Chloroflexota bacterium]